MVDEGPSQWHDAFDEMVNRPFAGPNYDFNLFPTKNSQAHQNKDEPEVNAWKRKLRKEYLRDRGISDVAVLGLESGKVPPEVLSKFSKEVVATKPNKIPPKVLPKYIREDTKK